MPIFIMKTIHKVIAIVIRDGKILMVRKKGKDIWTNLGGRIEPGETEGECLLREIREEIGIDAEISGKLGDFEDKAVFDDAKVKLSAFFVELDGDISIIDPELEEFKFIGKIHSEKLAPLVENEIMPMLAEKGII
jgi:8-oxo-dGTP pyrophosphatase MutT (NUDIX family)